MLRRAIWVICLVLALAFCVAAQAQEGYLDEEVFHVKPEKRAAFDALAKKVAAANRANQGDNWTAAETIYGEGNTITIVSGRQSYAEIEKASGAFMGAMEKAMGHPGTEKLFEDVASCITDSHTMLLRRRPDLSNNLPSDPAARNKIVGSMRWIRTNRIVVRFGMGPRFEELAKQIKAAREKADSKSLRWVSQSAAGDQNGVYYISQLEPSLAGFDTGNIDLKKILGDDAYEKLLKSASEVIQSEETTITQFLPELSNPPADIVNAAPDFWRPKATGSN